MMYDNLVTKEETISDSTFRILDNIFLDQIKCSTQVFLAYSLKFSVVMVSHEVWC